MSMPIVSVIIPAYNQAAFLDQAIQSVLDQTFTDFELIVVNDGSTDNTADVIKRFADDRLRYIYQGNRGLPSARNTGLTSANGKYICFLDSDDAYLPRKLEAQVAHLERNADLDVSYGANLEIDRDGAPTWLSWAPANVTLADLVLGFPFNINDVLIKREWIERVNGFDESYRLHGEDRPFYTDLALAGATFRSVDDFVSYRRLYPERRYKDIPSRLALMLRAVERVFSEPRCPDEVLSLKNQANAGLYLAWAFQAYMQKEADLGRDYLQEALRLQPALCDQDGVRVRKQLVWANIRSGDDHEMTLPYFFDQLPDELAWLGCWKAWCIGWGHLQLGFSDTLWGRTESAEVHFCAAGMHVKLDEGQLKYLVEMLVRVEALHGAETADLIVRQAMVALRRFLSSGQLRRMQGTLAVNRGFRHYHAGLRSQAASAMLEAITANPLYLTNRGVWATLFGIARIVPSI